MESLRPWEPTVTAPSPLRGTTLTSGDGAVTVGSHGVVAPLVSCRHDHNDSRSPGGFDGLAEGIIDVRLVHLPAQRKIDHPDVVGALECDGLLNGGNHQTIGARAVLIQHAKVDQLDVRRDSHERACARLAGRSLP